MDGLFTTAPYRARFFLVLACVSLSPLIVGAEQAAARFEHVPEKTVAQLQQSFDEALPQKHRGELGLSPAAFRGKWTCDLYGARTRFQKKTGVTLYHFDEDMNNSGASPFRVYQRQHPRHLTSSLPDRNLRDELRMIQDNRFVGRIYQASDSQTVTWSDCRRLDIKMAKSSI
jgi:hypothetical protein